MKNIILVLAAIFSLQTVDAQYDKVQASVDGLGCPFCANGLERAFRDMKDKKQFNVDLEKGIMSFVIPESFQVSADDIISRVDKAGYTVKTIHIERNNGKEVSWSSDTKKTTQAEEKYVEKIIGVSGNCGMCKTRIENAVNELDGIFFVFWNQETQKLHVRYNEALTSQQIIEEHIAAVGHDTENVRAEDHVYENLHGCCLYERKQ